MTSRKKHTQKQQMAEGIVPFQSAEDAWFWFIRAQEARNDGARYSAGLAFIPRPCEPVDILKAVDGLYRQRRLVRDHLLVLRHYGRRHVPPDRRRLKEARAHQIWMEAMARIEAVLERKGIVVRPRRVASNKELPWFAMEGVAAE